MKPRCVWLALLLWLAVVQLHSEEIGGDWTDRPRLLVTAIAAPLSPSLSLLEFSLPFRSLGLRGAAADLEGSLWYLADSAYLFPRSYLELGAGLDWTWLRTGRVALSAGLGTSIGYEIPTRSVSVPLISAVSLPLDSARLAAFGGCDPGFPIRAGGRCRSPGAWYLPTLSRRVPARSRCRLRFPR